MNSKEREKFREHINEFSRGKIVGWLCAISFILSMDEASSKLRCKLKDMFDICDDVIKEKEQ